MAGTRRVGAAMTGANDFGKAIGGIDSSDVYQFGEIRDTDPASNVNGLVVRNIPAARRRSARSTSISATWSLPLTQ